ncbi:ABA4-like family protein [Roseomonas sp. HF4]|uniref:ABA4-like family protein n=1 Tax=Roseomonas sp. HF4 TaxID=2562313 RepID=UPI0010C14EC5|nr:ABA4-like family protein [Roseomonas sp. HF4]
MHPEAIFTAASSLATAGWLALLLFPRRRWAHWHLAGVGIPALLSLLYVVLLAMHAPGAEGGFSTLAGVRALFARDGLLLAGWVHYLAFDLFLGAWMCRRATAEGLSPWRLYPALPLTFLAGPAGLLVFLGLRALPRRQGVP